MVSGPDEEAEMKSRVTYVATGVLLNSLLQPPTHTQLLGLGGVKG